MPFTDIFMTQEGGSRGALGPRHPKSQWVGRPCPFRGPGWAGAQDQLPGPLPASHPAEFLKGLSLRPGRACWALEDSPQGAPAPGQERPVTCVLEACSSGPLPPTRFRLGAGAESR